MEPALLVVERLHHAGGDLDRELEVIRIERDLVEIDDPLQQEGVGLEQLHAVALAVAPAVVETSALLIPQVFLDKVQVLLRRGEVQRFVQHASRPGDRP